MSVDPRKLDPNKFSWSASYAADTPTAEPVLDLEAQLEDLTSDSERRAVYYSPEQKQYPDPPKGAIVIEDFDDKGGVLVAKDLETADYALSQQSSGRNLQEIIGELTLSGSGKPNIPDDQALVVQKQTPNGAVQRESVVATPEEAAALQIEWGEGTVITGVPEAVRRRASMIQGAARDANLSAQLVANVMTQESGGHQYARSGAGAIGLMQLMEGTAKDLGVDPYDAAQNVKGGARYLRQMLDKYDQDLDKALAAYNWGPGNLDKHLERTGANWKAGLPEETANYVAKLGGTRRSERLAAMEDPGVEFYPTRESMAKASRMAQAALIPGLQDSPILREVDWETAPSGGGGGKATAVRPTRLDPSKFQWGAIERAEPEDEYGWGIKNAWMRGWIRLGQLVDIAQGDVEEYTEGAADLKKYGVSEQDQKRLEELQKSDGFWSAIGYYITNPALAMQVVVESLPMSIAPLIGGAAGGAAGTAVGGPIGTILGGAIGAGAGSFGTEYLASWDEVMQETGLDPTDPEAVKRAFSDPEIIERAREIGAKRGIGVAAFDALSMGIAGRLYRPLKGLAGPLKKTGAVVGGTSELIAQSGAGALGEMSAQTLAGQERDWAAIAGEAVGEIVPGVGEMAINKALGKDIAGNAPEDDTNLAARDVPEPPPTGAIPPTGEPPAPGAAPPNVSDIDKEAEDQKIAPPPEGEQATTPTKPPETKASVPQGEDIDIGAALKAAAEKENAEETARLEAKDAEGAETEVKTPLITIKDMAPKLSKTFTAQEQAGPVRTAWKGVVTALTERYSDVDLPSPKGAFTGTGLARFFKKLQEEVDITKDIPEINELLSQISNEQAPADIIKILNGLAGKIRDEAPSLGAAALPGSVAAQAQAEYNNFVPWFNKHRGEGAGKKTKGQANIKGTPKRIFAEKLGQFAAAVRSMVNEAEKAGVIDLEGSGLDANWMQSLEAAERAMNDAMAPREKKTKLKSGEAGKTQTIDWRSDSLVGIADDVVAIAENLTPKLAAAEQKAAEAKPAKGEAKVKKTSPVTEAPAKPKTETPGQKARKKAKAANRQADKKKAAKEAQLLGEADDNADRVYSGDDYIPADEPTPQQRLKAKSATVLMNRFEKKGGATEDEWAMLSVDIHNAGYPPDLVARAEKLRTSLKPLAEVVDIEDAKPPKRGSKQKVEVKGETRSYNELRKRAKELGLKTTGKKDELAARVQEAESDEGAAVDRAEAVQAQAEETARQKKIVPARYRGEKYFFHAVRNDEDIATIIKEGLRPGTNVSRIGGQALSGEGDTILVFEGPVDEKGYQDDQFAKGGERPIAIIKDTTLEEREGDTRAEAAVAAEAEAILGEIYALADEYGVSQNDGLSLALEYDPSLPTRSKAEIRTEAEDMGFTPSAIKKMEAIGKRFAEANRAIERFSVEEDRTVVEEKVTEADVLQRYRQYGVSVYSTKGTKVKPDVAGAHPDAVFNPEPKNLVGAESREAAKLVEAESLDDALERAGVKKGTVKVLRGVKDVLTKEQFDGVVAAVYDFMKNKNMVRVAGMVQDAIGNSPVAPQIMEAVADMALAFDEAKKVREQELAEVKAEEEMLWDEDEREILGLTGQTFDVDDEGGVDEWGVGWDDRLRSFVNATLGEISPALPPAEQQRLKIDRRIMKGALDKIRDQLARITKSAENPNPESMSMQELVGLLIGVLPNNHRYTHLLKMIKDSDLREVQVTFTDNLFDLDEYGKTGGHFRKGVHPDGTVDPNASTIEVLYDPESRPDNNFMRTLLHEMLHAVTTFAYTTDRRFRTHIDTLWYQAVKEYANTDPNFPMAEVDAVLNTSPDAAVAAKIIERYFTNHKDKRLVNTFYGLVKPEEMIAEAFTNPYFQGFLATTPLKQEPGLQGSAFTRLSALKHNLKTLLDSFIRGIQQHLGISIRNSILEEVLLSTTANFDNYITYSFANRAFRVKTAILNQKIAELDDRLSVADKKIIQDAIDKDPALAHRLLERYLQMRQEPKKVVEEKLRSATTPTKAEEEKVKKKRTNVVNNVADAARGRDKYFRDALQILGQKLKDLPERTNLGFMARDQIERKYRRLFEVAAKSAGMLTSPLTRYIKAKQAASVLAREYAEAAHKALTKAQKLSNKTRSKMFTLMRDTTLYEVWPHVSLRDELNAHLWSKPNKKTGVSTLNPTIKEAALQVRKDYEALKAESPEAAALLLEMAELTKQIQDAKRSKSLRLIGQSHELGAVTVEKLAATKTLKELRALFKEVYDGKELLDKGTYPESMVSEKGESKEEKKKKTEAREEFDKIRSIARAAESVMTNTAVRGPYFPLRRYGHIVVASTEEWNENNPPYVSFHSNKWEAARVQAELKRKFNMDTKQARKIESTALSHDMESVVSELKARIKDGGAGLHAKIDTAMLEVLAENTAYASALKRHGIDGVSSDDMGRAFEEYVYVAKYTLGDLETTFEISEAFKDLRKLQSAIGEESGRVSQEAKDRIGMVVNELAEQNKEDTRDREMSALGQAVGAIGFFNFLGAPSYWILNATQTLTVTLPYITGKWGVKKGQRAYRQAAGIIYKAAKGAKSYEQFKKNLPEAARKVVERMEDENIIQSTIAHEFGDMLSGSTIKRMVEGTGLFGKSATAALRLMEKVPETVEKYNRISTALAIYNLSGGSMVEVADGVQATQFNYDSANRARLLKAAPKWAGGGLRPLITPIMMFKTYGIGLARLLYGNIAKGLVGQTAKERSEARRIAGGLIISHSVFGGVAGGIMMAPVQVLVEVFNAAFREAGDEFDPEEAIELFLQENANDMVAALAARGLPAAMGVDMSKSVNLGNLLWLGNDRIDLSKAGGVETALATGLGPVAQYAITSVREGHRLFTGDPTGNWWDFTAAVVPLKMLRGMIRGAKYEFEGVGTDTLTWMDPDDVSGWIRMAMGFRPTGIAMKQDYEYNLLARDTRRSKRKSTLIDRAARATTSAERAAVWDDIEEFNKSLPRADRINRGDVVRLKSQRRTRQRQYDRGRR